MSDIEVCYNVGLEPCNPATITNERLHHCIANTEDGARVNSNQATEGFCENDRQCAFFDVSVFNPLTQTNCSLLPSTLYRRHEQVKKGACDQRFREVEHGCFSSLILSASGVMGPIAKLKWFTIS